MTNMFVVKNLRQQLFYTVVSTTVFNIDNNN